MKYSRISTMLSCFMPRRTSISRTIWRSSRAVFEYTLRSCFVFISTVPPDDSLASARRLALSASIEEVLLPSVVDASSPP